MITQKEIENWLADVLGACEEDHDVTCFKSLEAGSDLHLVASWDEDEGGVKCKIAYNCDDLQCDYDCDWYMPSHKDGDVWYAELTLKEDGAKSAARYFREEAKAMAEQILEGNVVCG